MANGSIRFNCFPASIVLLKVGHFFVQRIAVDSKAARRRDLCIAALFHDVLDQLALDAADDAPIQFSFGHGLYAETHQLADDVLEVAAAGGAS